MPVTFFVMISRVAAVSARSLYLLGDLDKPFGVFDTLTYGWRSVIESMRIRAEFGKRAYHKAREIREKGVKLADDGRIFLAEEKDANRRQQNSWIGMTPLAEGGE